ncbi:E3 ubiquitin-protein ligase rad18 [Dimargaris verticillata]|uniref:Postreplication repair E3 ubiquitin-protein ligase RAD18 n=1 Tax=Dimargaris verticillata TaxID=2761393 RepID=A0A9W8B0H1_9FUNG|nr:E3 ubiquitin-protein ligase rad18 [Dimargaris verticillata]
MQAYELEDPNDWPLHGLRDLDSHLRCGICKEYFTAAVIVSECRHHFCSLCLRRALSAAYTGVADTRTQCPSCRAPIDSQSIHPDPLLNEIVASFRVCRPQLLTLVNRGLAPPETPKPTTRKRNKRTHAATSPPSGSRHRYATRSRTKQQSPTAPVAITVPSTDSESDFQPDSAPPHSLHRTPTARRHDGSSEQQGSRRVHESDTDLSVCPICQCAVPTSTINRHLDACLGIAPPSDAASPVKKRPKTAGVAWLLSAKPSASSTVSMAPHQPQSLPRPTKLVYSIMTDKQLRKALKDLGLSTQGDKAALQRRHTEYLNLYLANEDAPNPKPIHRLIQDLQHWEKSLTLTASSTSSTPTPQLNVASSKAHDNARHHPSRSRIPSSQRSQSTTLSDQSERDEPDQVRRMIAELKAQRERQRQSKPQAQKSLTNASAISADAPNHSLAKQPASTAGNVSQSTSAKPTGLSVGGPLIELSGPTSDQTNFTEYSDHFDGLEDEDIPILDAWASGSERPAGGAPPLSLSSPATQQQPNQYDVIGQASLPNLDHDARLASTDATPPITLHYPED